MAEDYAAAAAAAAGITNWSNGQLNITGPDVIQGYGAGANAQGGWNAPAAATVTTTPDTAQDAYWTYKLAQEKTDAANQKREVIDTVSGLFNQYGLGSLYSKVVEYAQAGYGAESIAILLRATPEYATRFPAMKTLNERGRAISESQYIDYESTAASLEERYGLPKGMIMGNVTNLLIKDVSVSELNDRVVIASADSLTAPQDLKDTLKQYYNLGSDALSAYYLDPEIAVPLLEKQSASARIGVEAVRQGIAFDVNSAENLQGLGISSDQARQGFGTVAASTGLTTGRGDTTTQKELIAGTLAGDQAAQANIARAAGSRVGRFQQGGEFLSTQQGRGRSGFRCNTLITESSQIMIRVYATG